MAGEKMPEQYVGLNIYHFEGKKILWTGTSIPETAYAGGWNYPSIVAELLGCTVLNTALSGAPLRISKVNGDLGGIGTPLLENNFTRTEAEYQTVLSGLGYGQPEIDTLKLNSYENKLIPYADYDLVLFDWSVNDYGFDSTDFNTPVTDFSTRDRAYYVGAFNYAIEKLLEANPRARFAIVTHWRQAPWMAEHVQIQKDIADYWGCAYIDMSKTLGWANTIVPGTGNAVFEPWCPDGTHPYTDTTGESTWKYARVLAEWIKGIN